VSANEFVKSTAMSVGLTFARRNLEQVKLRAWTFKNTVEIITTPL
jgi:hypothetical protein